MPGPHPRQHEYEIRCTAAQTKRGRSLRPMFPSSVSATIRKQVMLHVVKHDIKLPDIYSYKGTIFMKLFTRILQTEIHLQLFFFFFQSIILIVKKYQNL